MKQYIGIIRDHSGSMSSLANTAKTDYNNLIAEIKKNAIDNSLDTIISVMECGVRSSGYSGRSENKLVVKNSSILGVKPIETYIANGGSTPLYDAVGKLISTLMEVPDAADPDVSFLLMVLTDGQENSSNEYTAHSLRQTITKLQNSDKWSFTFRVPPGNRYSITHLGVHSNNIYEWETSNKGLEQATVATASAITAYYSDRVSGATSTRSFYSTDMTDVSAQKVKSALQDVTDEVKLFQVPFSEDGSQIRDFIEQKINGNMKKGASFYQLTKKEDEVQEYKQILIRDKKSKKIYAGVHARQLLGLPFIGTVKIVPGNHGNYDIFIQSTSVNRKLVGGTSVLYWEAVGEDYKEPRDKVKNGPSPLSKKQAAPTKSDDEWFIEGYRAGFLQGKAKLPCHPNSSVQKYIFGYEEGHKHGRGKKKNMYPA
jgi:hypothetical protein